MSFKRITAISLITFTISGCSIFQRGPKNEAGPGFSPLEKNVPTDAREDSPRKRIMILPFIDMSGIRAGSEKNVNQIALSGRAALVSWLAGTERFVVINNEDFPKDLNQFLNNYSYDVEAIAKIANGMGVAAVVEAKILEIRAKKMGNEIGVFRKVGAQVDGRIQIRVVAAKNGKELLSSTKDAQIEATTTKIGEGSTSSRDLLDDPKLVGDVVIKALKNTVRPMAQAIDKLSWEGRIALVKGEQYYINAGRLSGLQIGDILKVTEDSEEVYDPDNGSFIGHVPGRMKGTLELVSYFGKDGAIAVLHSGAGVNENDRVELY